jgi:hypothetical protein
VCVRHRASQTLYVSGVIEPHACIDPGYGKLQVGIYVAAIQDAMDRKQQQQHPLYPNRAPLAAAALISGNKDRGTTRGSGSGHQGTPKGGHGIGKSGRFQDSPGGKGPTDELALKVRWS